MDLRAVRRMRRLSRFFALVLVGAASLQWVAAPAARETDNHSAAAEIDDLVKQMRRIHWNLFHTTSQEQFDRAVAALKTRLPGQERETTLTEIARLAALVGDGHTRFWLNRPRVTGFGQVALRLYRFEDGWYVRALDATRTWAVGARVLGIGSLDIEEAVQRVGALISQDSPQTALAIAPDYLVIPEVLKAIGAIPTSDSVPYRLETAEGERVLHLPRLDGRALPGVNVDEGTPGSIHDHVRAGDTVKLVSARSEKTPLWLSSPEERLLSIPLPDQRALYVRVMRVADTESTSFLRFMEDSFDEAIRRNVDRYVLDLRQAWGGNNQVARPAVLALVRRVQLDEPGRVWVLIGRHTFSAAMTLTTLLDQMTSAIFVGEPTGGRPNYYADARPARLPGMGLVVGVSSLYWQDSNPQDERAALQPDLAVDLSLAAYRAGTDPVLAAALTAAPPPPIASILKGLVESERSEEALSAFRKFRENPQFRFLAAREAPLDFFLRLGDELVEVDLETARRSYSLAVRADPTDEDAAGRDRWFRVADASDSRPAPDLTRFLGNYGVGEVRIQNGHLVYRSSEGSEWSLALLDDGAWAMNDLELLRIRFASGDSAAAWLEFVQFDGASERHGRVSLSASTAP